MKSKLDRKIHNKNLIMGEDYLQISKQFSMVLEKGGTLGRGSFTLLNYVCKEA